MSTNQNPSPYTITAEVQKLRIEGLSIEDIEKQSGITLVSHTTDDNRRVFEAKDEASFATFQAFIEYRNAPTTARVSSARAARSDRSGYSRTMGARVTRRDNRAGYTEYNDSIQIWD